MAQDKKIVELTLLDTITAERRLAEVALNYNLGDYKTTLQAIINSAIAVGANSIQTPISVSYDKNTRVFNIINSEAGATITYTIKGVAYTIASPSQIILDEKTGTDPRFDTIFLGVSGLEVVSDNQEFKIYPDVIPLSLINFGGFYNFSTGDRKSKSEVFELTQEQIYNALILGVLQLDLLNDIATDSAVWVETENIDLKSGSEFQYNSGDNFVNIYINSLYFQFSEGDKVIVKYFYDAPLSQIENRDLELLSLVVSVDTANDITVDYEIRNNAASSDVAIISLNLENYPSEEIIIELLAGQTVAKQKIYNNVNPGTYNFSISGDVAGSDSIVVPDINSLIQYSAFSLQENGTKYTVSAKATNFGSVSGLAKVYFQIDSDPLIPSIEKNINVWATFIFSYIFESVSPGSHTFKVYEDDAVTLIGSETIVVASPETVLMQRADVAYYDPIKGLPLILKSFNHSIDSNIAADVTGYYYNSGNDIKLFEARARFQFDVTDIVAAVGAEIVFLAVGELNPASWPFSVHKSNAIDISNISEIFYSYDMADILDSVTVEQLPPPFDYLYYVKYRLTAGGVAILNSSDILGLMFVSSSLSIDNLNSKLISDKNIFIGRINIEY